MLVALFVQQIRPCHVDDAEVTKACTYMEFFQTLLRTVFVACTMHHSAAQSKAGLRAEGSATQGTLRLYDVMRFKLASCSKVNFTHSGAHAKSVLRPSYERSLVDSPVSRLTLIRAVARVAAK